MMKKWLSTIELLKRRSIRLPDYAYSSPTVSYAVGALKRLVNRSPGHDIWQRSVHEHVIRNEHDHRAIWEYVDANPAKWAEDRYYAQ